MLTHFSPVFIPFMVGSISLIAYLSLRNFNLANRIRKLTDYLISVSAGERVESQHRCVRCESIVKQIRLFLTRYLISNAALRWAIISVVLFGLMVAIAIIISTETWRDEGKAASILGMMVLGGLSASWATIKSIEEAKLACHSISEEVASALLCSGKSLKGTAASSEVRAIGVLIKSLVDSNTHGAVALLESKCNANDD